MMELVGNCSNVVVEIQAVTTDNLYAVQGQESSLDSALPSLYGTCIVHAYTLT